MTHRGGWSSTSTWCSPPWRRCTRRCRVLARWRTPRRSARTSQRPDSGRKPPTSADGARWSRAPPGRWFPPSTRRPSSRSTFDGLLTLERWRLCCWRKTSHDETLDWEPSTRWLASASLGVESSAACASRCFADELDVFVLTAKRREPNELGSICSHVNKADFMTRKRASWHVSFLRFNMAKEAEPSGWGKGEMLKPVDFRVSSSHFPRRCAFKFCCSCSPRKVARRARNDCSPLWQMATCEKLSAERQMTWRYAKSWCAKKCHYLLGKECSEPFFHVLMTNSVSLERKASRSQLEKANTHQGSPPRNQLEYFKPTAFYRFMQNKWRKGQASGTWKTLFGVFIAAFFFEEFKKRNIFWPRALQDTQRPFIVAYVPPNIDSKWERGHTRYSHYLL